MREKLLVNTILLLLMMIMIMKMMIDNNDGGRGNATYFDSLPFQTTVLLSSTTGLQPGPGTCCNTMSHDHSFICIKLVSIQCK